MKFHKGCVTVGAVHTHTHTHTDSYLKEEKTGGDCI